MEKDEAATLKKNLKRKSLKTAELLFERNKTSKARMRDWCNKDCKMNSCYHLCSKQGVTAVVTTLIETRKTCVYTVTTSSTPAWVFLYNIIWTLNLFLNPLIGTPRKKDAFIICSLSFLYRRSLVPH